MRPELGLLNLHFLNICRHHPTLKFKPHATDDERYVSGIDGVPLISARWQHYRNLPGRRVDDFSRRVDEFVEWGNLLVEWRNLRVKWKN